VTDSRTLIMQMIYYARCGTSESCGHLDENGECLLRPWSAYFVDKNQDLKKNACPPAHTIMVGVQRVESVENFMYFGCQLSSVDGTRTEQDGG